MQDPSEFAISFPYATTFSRLSVNPNQLLQTSTLGVAATNTTITVRYRHGGGLNHNIPSDSLTEIETLSMSFPRSPSVSVSNFVRTSLEITNTSNGSGGEDAPTVEDLVSSIPSFRNSQSRIVTKEDLIARIYTLPSNFGRVFRASVISNPNNPLSTQLFIISRNENGELIVSPDTLKQNLQKFLSPYRLVSDAIDVLDAKVVNVVIKFDILCDPSLKKESVLKQCLVNVKNIFEIKNMYIDKPINVSEIRNAIFKVPGVVSVDKILVENIRGTVNNKEYSTAYFDIESNTSKGLVIPNPGTIFEIRYPDIDIIGRAI